MKCPMCGKTFDRSQAEAGCQGCFIARMCGLIKCPNCFYEMPAETAWYRRLIHKLQQRNLFNSHSSDQSVSSCCSTGGMVSMSKDDKDNQTPIPLTEVGQSRKVIVSHVNTQDREALRELLSMGMWPDTEIEILRKFPGYYLQIGKSQLAIDKELASYIYVRVK